MVRRSFFVLAAALPSLAAAPPSAAAGTLTIEVANVRVARGRVHVDVCPEGKFLKDGCPFSASAVARQGVTTVVVPDLPAGRYAVQAFLDENGNNRVDMGFFGKIPKEGVGFSNDPKLTFAPPKFADAAFAHPGAEQLIHLKLRYYL